MIQPTPAIVAQSAVRRIPRLILLLVCAAYVIPGFIGRDAWKAVDMASLGFMSEIALGHTPWFTPLLLGSPPSFPSLLPYWLGAWAMQWAPLGLPSDFAARIPFMGLLALGLVATWYATYYLARRPGAQPVAFAFGGEANTTDYARAIADGGVLALIACLGLAHLGHETTPALAQLGFAALTFFGFAALAYYRWLPGVALALGLLGLALSGAPAMALTYGVGGAVVHILDTAVMQDEKARPIHRLQEAAWLLLLLVGVGTLAWQWQLWSWKIQWPHATWNEWNGYAQLLIWFTWPAGPLALWTAWRWRLQLFTLKVHSHLVLPLWFILVTVAATLTSSSPDRNLLLALPALATMAAFALPTLKRQVSALIDWFTLLFFTSCGFTIWVIWLAMQTGFPSQPAANVARLAPGFVPSFSLLSLVMALAATAAWLWLVKWRVGRHRAALWKSLVLPGCGAALCWLLLMTLWMPLLNYSQSYESMVRRIEHLTGAQQCVQLREVDLGPLAAMRFYGHMHLVQGESDMQCPWLVLDSASAALSAALTSPSPWLVHDTVRHPVEPFISLTLLKRTP